MIANQRRYKMNESGPSHKMSQARKGKSKVTVEEPTKSEEGGSSDFSSNDMIQEGNWTNYFQGIDVNGVGNIISIQLLAGFGCQMEVAVVQWGSSDPGMIKLVLYGDNATNFNEAEWICFQGSVSKTENDFVVTCNHFMKLPFNDVPDDIHNLPVMTYLNGELTYVDVVDNSAKGTVTCKYWNRDNKCLSTFDLKFVLDANYLIKTIGMFKLKRRVRLVGMLDFTSGCVMKVVSVNFLDSGNGNPSPQKRADPPTFSSPKWKTLKK